MKNKDAVDFSEHTGRKFGTDPSFIIFTIPLSPSPIPHGFRCHASHAFTSTSFAAAVLINDSAKEIGPDLWSRNLEMTTAGGQKRHVSDAVLRDSDFRRRQETVQPPPWTEKWTGLWWRRSAPLCTLNYAHIAFPPYRAISSLFFERQYFCHLLKSSATARVSSSLSPTGGSTSKATSADVSAPLIRLFASCPPLVEFLQGETSCLFIPECNAAIHKRCIEKIIGKCTGSAANSRDTMVSKS